MPLNWAVVGAGALSVILLSLLLDRQGDFAISVFCAAGIAAVRAVAVVPAFLAIVVAVAPAIAVAVCLAEGDCTTGVGLGGANGPAWLVYSAYTPTRTITKARVIAQG